MLCGVLLELLLYKSLTKIHFLWCSGVLPEVVGNSLAGKRLEVDNCNWNTWWTWTCSVLSPAKLRGEKVLDQKGWL